MCCQILRDVSLRKLLSSGTWNNYCAKNSDKMKALHCFLAITIICYFTCVEGSFSPQEGEEIWGESNNRSSRFFWMLGSFQRGIQIDGCGSNNEYGYCDTALGCRIKGGVPVVGASCGSGVCCHVKAVCSKGSTGSECVILQTGALITEETGSGDIRVYKFPKVKRACQIKLDFDVFEIAGDDTLGDCLNESLTVLGSSTVRNFQICGINTGQHMYLEYSSESYISLSLKRNPANFTKSKYIIRPTFIKCSSPKRVPRHCLQHFSAPQGTVLSFNNNIRQLNNQRYKVCVDDNDGSTSIRWKTCNNDPNNFFITGTGEPSDSFTSFVSCPTDWVGFSGHNMVYCGLNFSRDGVTLDSKPYIMDVSFNGQEQVSISSSKLNDPTCSNTPNLDPAAFDYYVDCMTVEGPPNCACTIDFDKLPPNFQALLNSNDKNNTGFCLEYSLVQ